jgi:hypothetical protein
VGHVGYHVRKLQQLDLIELVDEKPVRGAVEHFYRGIERPMVTEEEFKEQTVAEREVWTRTILQHHVADIARSMDEHTFDARVNRVISRIPMVVDEEGFAELSDLHMEAWERTLEIQAKSAERMTQSKEEGIPTVSTTMFFETPERGATERAVAKQAAE